MNWWLVLFVILLLVSMVPLIPTDTIKYKNCISGGMSSSNPQHVPIDSECPAGSMECPWYPDGNNDNIPVCHNQNSNGITYSNSCPTFENGEWKCDYFQMGTGADGMPRDPTDSTIVGDCPSGFDCQLDECQSNPDCKWGSFNSNGWYKYAGRGVIDKNKVTGYKVFGSSDYMFILDHGVDGSEHLGASVEEIQERISLSECIKEAEKYYDSHNYGSFGLVYDKITQQCNLHRLPPDYPLGGTGHFLRGD